MYTNIKNTILNFKNLIYKGYGSPETNEEKLVELLDTLAYAAHIIEYAFDKTEYSDLSNTDYEDLYNAVKHRFPNYGHYNIVEDIEKKLGDTKTNIADAIDDIADIVFDLENVIWRGENTSEPDALWKFETSFKTHWCYHLRRLQYYLVERRRH